MRVLPPLFLLAASLATACADDVTLHAVPDASPFDVDPPDVDSPDVEPAADDGPRADRGDRADAAPEEELGDPRRCAPAPEQDLPCARFWASAGLRLSHAFLCPDLRDARAVDPACAATSLGAWRGYCCSGDAGAPAGPACSGLPIEALARTGTRTVVRGDTTAAWLRQTAGRSVAASQRVAADRPNPPCVPMVGQRVFEYVVGPAAASLAVTTSEPGTDPLFNSVLYVGTGCGESLTGAVCGDDDGREGDPFSPRPSSYVETDVLPAGTRAFIVLGGSLRFNGVGGGDHGAFALSVTELAVSPEGGPCDAAAREFRCEAASSCVLPTPGAERGTCRRRGTVAGAGCRADFPRCDGDMPCFDSRRCVGVAASGGRCDPAHQCPATETCVPAVFGSTVGTCRPNGAARFAFCRASPVGERSCDAPLACSYASPFNGACGVLAPSGGPCNLRLNVCPPAETCVAPGRGALAGTCRRMGDAPGDYCSLPMACAEGLVCSENRCVRAAASGGACDALARCPEGETCVSPDPLHPGEGVCRASGRRGGRCLLAAPRACAEGLRCSGFDPVGTCEDVAAAVGDRCEPTVTRCGLGLRCVLADGSPTVGTCRPEAETPRAVASGAPCDPALGTTRCPAGELCRAASERAGVCVGGARVQAEPDDAPDPAAPPVALPSVHLGALVEGDVDCFAVAVPAMGRVVALVSDGDGGCPASTWMDLVLDLYDPDGVTPRGTAARNGPFSGGTCAHIDGGLAATQPWAAGLAAGTYHVCVRMERNYATAARRVDYALSLATR